MHYINTYNSHVNVYNTNWTGHAGYQEYKGKGLTL